MKNFAWTTLVLLLGHSVTAAAIQDGKELPATEFETVMVRDFESEEMGQLLATDRFRGSEGAVGGVSDDSPHSGRQCFRIKAKKTDVDVPPGGGLRCELDARQFSGKRIRIRLFLDLEVGDESKTMMLFAEKLKSGDTGASDNFGERHVDGEGWTQLDIVSDIAEDAKSIILGFGLMGEGEIGLDDLTIEVVDDSISLTTQSDSPQTNRSVSPGLFEIFGSMDVVSISTVEQKGKDVCLLLPLPLLHRKQYPLTYNLTTRPAEALKSVRIYQDKPENYVAEVILHEFSNSEKVSIQFSSAILVLPPSFKNVPESAPVPEEWPKEALPWLKSTWCVESDHERIKEIASEIRADTDDVLQIINQVVSRAKSISDSTQGQPKDQTAVAVLDNKGVCTGAGNLVAALLRSSNVPARVLAGYPEWAGPLQTHYIVEAYVPDFGWYPIESTLFHMPWPNKNQINVSIVSPEHESKELAVDGVPYLSITEMPGSEGSYVYIGTIPGQKFADHQCKFIRKFEAEDAEWQRAAIWAKKRWQNWLESRLSPSDEAPSFGPIPLLIQADSPQSLIDELSSSTTLDNK